MAYHSILGRVSPGVSQAGVIGAAVSALTDLVNSNGDPLKVRVRASTQKAGFKVIRVNRNNLSLAQDALDSAGINLS
jgi:hypothetical protein